MVCIKRVVFITCGNNIKITDSKVWKDFIDGLNNPSQETIDNRRKFFEECDKLIITHKDDSSSVESEKLNEEEILKALRGTI